MKFHLPSFALGVASTLAVKAAAARLRPVVVEIGSLSLQLARLSRGVLERQKEHVEDLWAEIEDRVSERLTGGQPASDADGPVATSEPHVTH